MAKAISEADPGHKIVILPGTYHEQVTIQNLGSPTAPIVIQGQKTKQTGSLPVLDGEGTRAFGLILTDCENFYVENLEVKNYKTTGIAVSGGSKFTIRNNVVHDNGFASTFQDPQIAGEGYGIDVDQCQEVIIDGNETYNNGSGPDIRT